MSDSSPKTAIDYDHAKNLHTVEGAAAALAKVFDKNIPKSLLDIGAGTGTWLLAASDLGVKDYLGIDGIISEQHLHVPKEKFQIHDLTQPLDLGRKYDIVLSLEVAEHLPKSASNTFVASIVRHTDAVLFSAAAPGQAGDHHINCQWPAFWQALFNKHGFLCNDSVRWNIWDEPRIEPWYRQNVFWALRDPARAGKEPRIKAVIHPDMVHITSGVPVENAIKRIEAGLYPLKWYLGVSRHAAIKKIARRLYRS